MVLLIRLLDLYQAISPIGQRTVMNGYRDMYMVEDFILKLAGISRCSKLGSIRSFLVSLQLAIKRSDLVCAVFDFRLILNTVSIFGASPLSEHSSRGRQ